MISLKSLLEDAEEDKRFRSEAVAFYNKFVDFLENNADSLWQYFRRVRIDNTPCLSVNAGKIDSQYKDLDILFGPPDASGEMAGGFGVNKTSGYFLVVRILDKDTEDLELIDRLVDITTPDNKGTFIHEFIHYLDAKRWSGGQASFSKMAQSQKFASTSDYFNHPLEFNAYYQQHALQYVDALGRAIRGTPHRLTFYLPKTAAEFLKMAKKNFFRKEFLSALNPKYSRKLDKRLVNLYNYIKQKVKVNG